MTSAGTRLQGSGGEDFCDELRIPRSRQGYWLRETCAALRHVSVKYLVVKNRRDSESRVFDQPFLNRVGKLCSLARIFPFSLPCDLADTVLHDFRRPGRREIAAISGKVCLRIYLGTVGPKTDELRDFFFKCHPRDQIGDAAFNWQARILVIRKLFLRIHVGNRERK